MTQKTLIFLLTFFCINLIAQDKNARRLEHEEKMMKYRQKYSEEYKRTIVDSIEFKGTLLDMNFGGTCGTQRMAGVFIFKRIEVTYGKCPDSLAVFVQCAERDIYRKMLIKGQNYKIRVSPNKMKNWVGVKWEPYKDLKGYYFLEDNIQKVD